MRRLVCEYYDGFSFGGMIRQFPEMRGTLTDLLIGDLFHDRVDKVWAPLESLYKDGKTPIPRWDAGRPRRRPRTRRTNLCCLTAEDPENVGAPRGPHDNQLRARAGGPSESRSGSASRRASAA